MAPTEKIKFHRGRWVVDPPSRVEQWASRSDSFHEGFLFGVCFGGIITTIVMMAGVLFGT